VEQTQHSPIIIAIDGFSSSGKSTMARRLAATVGYRYLDTGAMYRAVTLYALDHGLFLPDSTPDTSAIIAALPSIHIDFAVQPDGTQHTLLNGKDVEAEIRRLRVSEAVSPVAAIAEVRHAMVAKQQELGRDKGIVVDGRDIGTVVFTDARRRFKERVEIGAAVNYEEVLANVVHRDHIDSTRAESPLRRADDAIALDNSEMTLEEQDAWLLEQFRRAAGL